MNIRHECPRPDLSFAVAAPLQVHKANGRRLEVARWSLEGLWTDPPEVDLAGEVILTVPFQGVDVSFPVTLIDGEEPGHYCFANLSVRQRETLATFHHGVLSGQMVPTGDMITSLDTPVDLVPMGETTEEEVAGRALARPRALRILWNAVVYLTLAAVLIVGLGGQVWTRLTQIGLDHARFAAPVVTYNAPDAGYLVRLEVAVGDLVEAGEILARIEDPDRESDVEDVRAEVHLAERRLSVATARLTRHEALRDARRAVLAQAFDQVWQSWQAHDPRATEYPPAILAAWQALYAFDRGRDTEAGGYFDLLETLRAAVEERALDLRRWKRELRHRKSAADELVIRARTGGTVFAIHAVENSFVGRDAPVIAVEDARPRVAVAWLDDRFAARVHIGMTADIRYSDGGMPKRLPGRVTDIQASVDIAQPDRFGMVLTITAEDMNLAETRAAFRHNAPAEVRLRRAAVFGAKAPGDD